MTKESESHGRVQPADHTKGRNEPFRDPPASAKDLAKQQGQLERLRSLMDEAGTMRDREVELEVECIEAEVLLKSASSEHRPDLDTRVATQIAEALHRKQALAKQLGIGKPAATPNKIIASDELERLHVARDALVAWLKAPNKLRSQHIPRVVYGVFLVVVVAIIWASVVIHPAILLVLVALAPPIAYLRMPRQDLLWMRLGAERKFKATGLKPPTSWQEAAVQARLVELDSEIEDRPQQTKASTEVAEIEEDELMRREVEYAQAMLQLDELLMAAGLDADGLDEEFGQWLELLGNARSKWNALDQLKSKRTKIEAEIDRGREAIFKFLSRQGEAPSKGYADLELLAKGIQRLIDQTGRAE